MPTIMAAPNASSTNLKTIDRINATGAIWVHLSAGHISVIGSERDGARGERALASHDPAAVLPRRLDQILARLGRAKCRMRRQRHVGDFRQRMTRRQRLDVE